MPAIASLEDLRAAQKKRLSINAMRHALCALLYGNGVASDGKIFVNCGWRRKKALGSGFGNSVFLLGGMSKGQRSRFCNPTFYKTRQGVINKKVGPALKHGAKGITQ